ncbi:hypothetical protein EJ08DRAFT_571228, partial [Tothia fuscella]
LSTIMSEASSAGSSVRSAERFGLDENDKQDILVYKYREGLEHMSQEKLCKYLDKEPRNRCSRIKIPRGNSRIEVRHGDLYPEKDRSKFVDKPNYKSNVASVGLPFGVRMKRLLFDQYQDLYLVSPDSSPENSPENSAHTTPSSTWG